jgi:hypothetical protein
MHSRAAATSNYRRDIIKLGSAWGEFRLAAGPFAGCSARVFGA